MKKTYQRPILEVVHIHTAQMLAASLGMSSTNASKNSDETYGLSRCGGSAWDDDDEE